MGHHEMNDYMSAIPILEAHEQTLLISVTSYPHMKPDHQKKLMHELQAKGQIEEKELDAVDIAKHFGWA